MLGPLAHKLNRVHAVRMNIYKFSYLILLLHSTIRIVLAMGYLRLTEELRQVYSSLLIVRVR